MAGKTKKNEIFSDLDLGFYPHPVTQAVTRKTNRDSVRQSVKSLVLTDYFERPFKSNIGCSIRYYLFENFTPAIKQQMERAVREVITNYEPRADIIAVLVEESPETHALIVSVAFMIINDPEPVILDVILERVR
jgi:phage baseplate assembly protein W|tara:strand:+ start:577 stop:978 length:402 start_codon:yes stop_codon:yes gene_type:complete